MMFALFSVSASAVFWMYCLSSCSKLTSAARLSLRVVTAPLSRDRAACSAVWAREGRERQWADERTTWWSWENSWFRREMTRVDRKMSNDSGISIDDSKLRT